MIKGQAKVQRLQRTSKNKFETMDLIIFIVLTIWGLLIIIPFVNVVMISFTTQKEYLDSLILLFPTKPTLQSYELLFEDGRIWGGYWTTVRILMIGVPMNLFLTTSLAYGLSRKGYPGRKIIFALVLFTMLFNGGIIPLYLVMKEFRLTNTLWAVILAYGVNTFYVIIMNNFFQSLPESLVESAKLDGAGEWKILYQIVLPLSMPIIATITLFYTVDRWNEWYHSMIFIRKISLQPLQLVLRSIVIDSQVLSNIQSGGVATIEEVAFTNGVKMAAVVVTIIPIMCVFPFLQKHFVKGIMIGAIK